jgi:TPP-dependent 2-oxoacid decarboxylase
MPRKNEKDDRMKARELIGDYLIRRLTELGVRHLFNASGDDIHDFSDLLGRSAGLQIINTCDGQGAGFAADAYARIKGMGAVWVGHGPGALAVVDAMARSTAEKSPVVVISEAPGEKRVLKRPSSPPPSGSDPAAQRRIFTEYSVASTIIDSARTAQAEIDRVLAAALRYKGSVHIELAAGKAITPCPARRRAAIDGVKSDPVGLQAAIAKTITLLNAARQPVILAGVEIRRFGLHQELSRLAGIKGIPVAATILAKSVIADTDRFSIGVCGEEIGRDEVRSFIASSDCLLALGALPSDLANDVAISAANGRICIGRHYFEDILLSDFLSGLLEAPITPRRLQGIPRPRAPRPFLHGAAGKKITVPGLFRQISSFMSEKTLIVADSGEALAAAGNLFIRQTASFLSPAVDAPAGFAVPAALAAQLADPGIRPLVLVGARAFRTTGMEVSTIARYGLNPIIIILNSRGSAARRQKADGADSDGRPWHFSKIPAVIGTGIGFIAETEVELEQALQTAEKNTESFTIIDVKLDRNGRFPALAGLTE